MVFLVVCNAHRSSMSVFDPGGLSSLHSSLPAASARWPPPKDLAPCPRPVQSPAPKIERQGHLVSTLHRPRSGVSSEHHGHGRLEARHPSWGWPRRRGRRPPRFLKILTDLSKISFGFWIFPQILKSNSNQISADINDICEIWFKSVATGFWVRIDIAIPGYHASPLPPSAPPRTGSLQRS
jgi:hypothetical protein